MTRCLALLLAGCALLLAPRPAGTVAPPPPPPADDGRIFREEQGGLVVVVPPQTPPGNVWRVRYLLLGYKESTEQLVRLGEAAHPAFEAILDHPATTAEQAARVFVVLREGNVKKRRFVERAARRLIDPNNSVRFFAAGFLVNAATAAEGPALVAALSDEYFGVPHAAARALAAGGGPRELVAMSAWLRGVAHKDDKEDRAHVTKCRDQLKARLAQSPK